MIVPAACETWSFFMWPGGWVDGCAHALIGDAAGSLPSNVIGSLLIPPMLSLGSSGVPLP